MRVIVDTNVFFSALFFPSPQFTSLMTYLFTECETLIPEYVADELQSKAFLKRPEQASIVADFLNALGVLTPEANRTQRKQINIHDSKDQPILDAAIDNDVDIIITGDKHFHALGLVRPRVMYPADFITEFVDQQD